MGLLLGWVTSDCEDLSSGPRPVLGWWPRFGKPTVMP
jgi:hypothetical protein